jgi:type IV secretion system protein VirD4
MNLSQWFADHREPLTRWFLQNRPILLLAGALAFADFFLLPAALGTEQYRPWAIFQALGSEAPAAKAVAGEWFLLNLAAVGGFLYWRTGRRPKHNSPDDASKYASHGSNRWTRTGELRAYLKKKGQGLILGREKDGLLVLPPDPTIPYNQNVTVLGSSGSRKTRSFVQPNLLQEAEHGQASIVCVDPKGENFRRSAHLLRQAGYEVRLLNFLDMAHSDRWNPLDAVTSTIEAADLAVNIVANTINPNRPSGGDPFWDQAEQSFITALVLYITQHRPQEERHMASVLELGAELHPNNLDYVFLQLPQDAPARRFYRTFLRADPKVRAGVVAGIGSRLQLWNIPEVVGLTAASDFSLRDLGLRKVALFLVIPDSKATYAPILALFWQQTFQLLYEVADKHGGALPNPVRCVMDEIANCGYIPDYAMKKSTMRSRRISTEEIWQSLGQMKNRYPHTWSELLANSDHLLVLGINDLDTAQYVSQLLGTTTIKVVGTGNTEGSTGGSASTSHTFLGRPLLTPDECRRLPTDEALLLPKGNFPARVAKVDYTTLPLAAKIQVEDHRSYQVPAHDPFVVINTGLLQKSVMPEEQELPQAPADGQRPAADNESDEDVTGSLA